MTSEAIVQKRNDMSNYLIHWTIEHYFHKIIESGLLKASLAPRGRVRSNPTIYGRVPAVCFSAMPIGYYIQSLIAGSRYWGKTCLIALPKRAIYAYGGRPVLYGDMDFCKRLNDSDKYLFCHFEDEIDWTHEREWRVKANVERNKQAYIHENDMVPIHLSEEGIPHHDPLSGCESPQFILIVERESDKSKLKLEKPNPYSTIYNYCCSLAWPNAKVFSLEHIKDARVYDLSELISPSEERSEEIAELWDTARMKTRTSAVDLIRKLLPGQYKSQAKPLPLEFSDWNDIEPKVQEIIRASPEAIGVLREQT